MTRKQLRQILDGIVSQYGNRTFDEWISSDTQRFVEQRQSEFGELQLEIQFLEKSPDHVHILFALDDGGLSAYFPVSTSVIYERFPGRDQPVNTYSSSRHPEDVPGA